MQQAENSIRIFRNIPFQLKQKKLFATLKIVEGSEFAGEITALIEEVAPLIRPKVVYRKCSVDQKDQRIVIVNGVEFSSSVLSRNLAEADQAFVFVVTSGDELDKLAISKEDILKWYWIDSIKEMALHAAVDFLREHIKNEYGIKKLPSMSPGSGESHIWPIE
ncbi:MAG: hypothetical protein SCK70_14790, partial [bacterium]|nr:hypothetical protein [bacterium]